MSRHFVVGVLVGVGGVWAFHRFVKPMKTQAG